MEDSPKAWVSCYRHPKKPASRDCAECGKPICGDCMTESGDPALCPGCREAAASGDKAAEAPLMEKPRPKRPPLTVSEVTIHDDGSVEAPRKAKGEAEVPRDDITTAPPTTAEEERPAAGPTTRVKSASTFKQLEAALPYGFAAGIGVIGFWLLIASIWHSWTQASIFTMGIAVPWALTRGSTVKKRMGVKIWKGPPRPVLIGLLSAGIMLPFVALAEYLAYKIVLRGSDLVNAGSKFVSLYFDSIGIFLIASGFILAFGVPYILRIGEGWRTPSGPGRFRTRVAKVFKTINRRAAK